MGRPLEKQVPLQMAKKYRRAQSAIQSLRIRGRVSSYYIFEISRAIDAGMFLSINSLLAVLLEIWLRDLLAIRKATREEVQSEIHFKWLITKYDLELESDKSLSAPKLMKELETLDVIDSAEYSWLKGAFQQLRNPLLHGLTGRLVSSERTLESSISQRDHPPTKEGMFLDTIFCDYPGNRIETFERHLDAITLRWLEETINFLANHEVPELV